MLWKWIEGIETVTTVGVLDIWQEIVENRGIEDRIGEGKRLEYRGNKNNEQNNLNGEWDLILLN